MIFRRELAELILAGEKTATRRRQNENPRSPWFKERCAYKVGQVFTINPGRGVKRIGEARATAVYAAPLSAVTAPEARQEGFRSVLAFRDAWVGIHGSLDLSEVVWVVGFELVPS